MTLECLEIAQAWRTAATQLGAICLVIGYLIGKFMPLITKRVKEWYNGGAPE